MTWACPSQGLGSGYPQVVLAALRATCFYPSRSEVLSKQLTRVQMNPYANCDLKKFMDSITPEKAEAMKREQIETSEKLHREFVEALEKGYCSICGGQIELFEIHKPCMHWFTYPSGIKKKKHFYQLLRKPLSYYGLDAYFRWLANSEVLFGNINDLKEDLSTTSYAETTIRYKNIEWAFSLGNTDLEGHQGAQVGQDPHYHIQMTVDGRPFIGFNDFHIRFTDSDLFTMEMIRQGGGRFHYEAYKGHGIGLIESGTDIELLDDHMILADDLDSAPFHRQTIIEAGEDGLISGDLVREAVLESQRTKEPIGKVLQRMLATAQPNASVRTIIAPGPGVPAMSKRSGKK